MLSEVQSREEGLKLVEYRKINFNVQNFQKYNPEKKDWNKVVIAPIINSWNLSEVQSREEGLKPTFVMKVQLNKQTFRSTIQRRRIETNIKSLKH